CAGAPCANTGAADSMPTTSPRAIRSIEASSAERARKGVTLTYSGLHENGHYFVSKEHALAGQPEPLAVAAQPPGLEKRLQIGAEAAADIDAVAAFNGGEVDSCPQAQSLEERVAELLVARHPADLHRGGGAARHCLDVFHRGRDVLPSHAAARRVRAAAEPAPVAVGPVFQVVARPP